MNCHPDRSAAKWRDLLLSHPLRRFPLGNVFSATGHEEVGPDPSTARDKGSWLTRLRGAVYAAFSPRLLERNPHPYPVQAVDRAATCRAAAFHKQGTPRLSI
jgi:hypothetical protein